MLYSGTDPESYITDYTLVYEDNIRQPEADIYPGFSERRRARASGLHFRRLRGILRGL